MIDKIRNIEGMKKLKAEELRSVNAGFDLSKLTMEEELRYFELKNNFMDIVKGKRKATVEEYEAAHAAVVAYTEELNLKYPEEKKVKEQLQKNV